DHPDVGGDVHVEAGLRSRPAARARQQLLLGRWLLRDLPAVPARRPALLAAAIPLDVALHLLGPLAMPFRVLVAVALGLLGPVPVPLGPLLLPVGAPVGPGVPAVVASRPPVEGSSLRRPQALFPVPEEHQRDDEPDEGHSPVSVTSNSRAVRRLAGSPAGRWRPVQHAYCTHPQQRNPPAAPAGFRLRAGDAAPARR